MAYIQKNDPYHNTYHDFKYWTPHDNWNVPNTSRNDQHRHDKKMDDHIQQTMALTNNLEDSLISYMANNGMTNVESKWAGLWRLFFKKYDHGDTFHVPVRRLITPDWLTRHKNNWQFRIGVNASTNDSIFSFCCLFLPFLENIRAYNSPWRNPKYSYGATVPRSSNIITNNQLWAKIQYTKQGIYSTVPAYDDLLLKYDKYNQPVLHPLFNLQQVYKNELHYSSDDECPPNSMEFKEYNGFLNKKVH